MNFFQLLVLGVVQGITEWIPVSSKTQVTFVYLKFFQGDPQLVVPILLYVHLGTVIAATLYFRKELSGIIREIADNPYHFRYHVNGKAGFLFVSLVCTGIIGIPLLIVEKELFSSIDAGLLYALMGGGLIVTGLLLLSQKTRNLRTRQSVSWKDGFFAGILQGFSVLPGISRSGTSTTGLIWRGFDSGSSFYLSFLLSIPTVILAEIILTYGFSGTEDFPVPEGIILLMTSFFMGYLTLDTLLRIVQKINIAYVVLILGAFIVIIGISGAG
ncbi:MAG: undecaprenyl pyrophosphate phosphatase [Methanoregula sp. PtaU1.Bin006]|uniref:undecaprenyl-diphosphate phosphatase n=1 Tax=Methanoregula sp. PtaU1.Bin006 TaxID=1811681 RepID=UPI0009CE699D|nr:undecaprenyl-diphosphate phosphatase [Methanoregula sp. PtaU1.Bin006]OPY37239.1 MAG: undecaprenyl pyrophosphate phosphatase [Methanoregula sp. PtaU1.Bin006]